MNFGGYIVLSVYSAENCFLSIYSVITRIILGYPNHCRRSKVKRGLWKENLTVEPMLPGFHEFQKFPIHRESGITKNSHYDRIMTVLHCTA